MPFSISSTGFTWFSYVLEVVDLVLLAKIGLRIGLDFPIFSDLRRRRKSQKPQRRNG